VSNVIELTILQTTYYTNVLNWFFCRQGCCWFTSTTYISRIKKYFIWVRKIQNDWRSNCLFSS
jgi:hypothetical protein